MPPRGLWRAVAVHRTLPELFEHFGPQLLEHAGGVTLAAWHFDLPRRRAETVACTAQRPPEVRGDVAQDALIELLSWARRGESTRVSPREAGALALLVPPSARHPLVMLPLSRPGCDGALVLEYARTPSEAQLAAGRELGEAFTVALANDRQLEALQRDKDAFAADKQALLARLGRDDIGDTIIGGETGLKHVVERIAQVASTDVLVLILGETGSGKELVARAIHTQSPRARGPLVRVNCGAIPPELVDSELFGHEAGSFTGAINTRKGWFERAHGGTLFLDEIGELPPAAQVRLLRVLQEGLLQRVGGEQSIRVDVRIVAATHRDLGAMVTEGRFREDLWYRLGTFPVRLPSLRERREDIPALAAHFARRAAQRLGAMPIEVTAADIALLVSYDWPGNVRELSAVIERAAILGNARRLEIAASLGIHQPAPAVRAASPLAAGESPAPVQPSARGEPAQTRAQAQSLDAATAEHIEAALSRCLGRVDGPFGAAQALGVNPSTLRTKMRRLGIDWRRYRSRPAG